MDLSNHYIVPVDDFRELQTVAWNQPTPTASERVATVLQTSTVCLGISAAFGVGAWVWAKAMMKLEDKKTANAIYEAETIQNIRHPK